MARSINVENGTAVAALLGRVKAIGIDYIFANSGTDFPPIIEGLAAADDPAPLLARADPVPCLDALAPWSPDAHGPGADCMIVQLGQDPLSMRSPVRNFRADLGVVCDLGPGLVALAEALKGRKEREAPGIAARPKRFAAKNDAARRRACERAAPDSLPGLMEAQGGLILSRALEGRRASVPSELGCPLAPMRLGHATAWYQEPHAGGLGWSFPAALGMQLADRERLVVATMGDGSYMFANPVACHQVAEALQLPVLLLVLNNAGWGAVRHAVRGLYPNGHAARANRMPLTDLSPSPDFTKVAEASRAWATRVEDARERGAKLDAALAHVMKRAGPALLDIRIGDQRRNRSRCVLRRPVARTAGDGTIPSRASSCSGWQSARSHRRL